MKYVYVLRSISHWDQLYVWVNSDCEQRLRYHNCGKCLHTLKFIPWHMIYFEEFVDDAMAFARERQIRKWSRGKKEELVCGDFERLKILSKRKKW